MNYGQPYSKSDPAANNAGFRCPICGKHSAVVDSRWNTIELRFRRRRKCKNGHLFTTYEEVEEDHVLNFQI